MQSLVIDKTTNFTELLNTSVNVIFFVRWKCFDGAANLNIDKNKFFSTLISCRDFKTIVCGFSFEKFTINIDKLKRICGVKVLKFVDSKNIYEEIPKVI